jgi:hypothetical protein
MEQEIAARYEEETRHINYTGGFIGGLLAAVGGAVGWSQLAVSFRSRLDVAGLVVGALVGYCVMTGAGGKRGRVLQQTAAVLALLGIILGYLFVSMRTQPASHRVLSGTGSAVLGALYALPDYLASMGLLGWLLLVAGVAAAYWIPHVRVPPQP